ncbi:uncharacterized protein LOC116853630 [Odontomachus brunneus]|uniref:uncharacterized protein LOC116853630 n=1 Tax=Odontomachus brunneus TaxID=486640 RepID=UPI0013F264C3|nr:uncharacterized protein LOC116853630 [Odontomachus brunneus]
MGKRKRKEIKAPGQRSGGGGGGREKENTAKTESVSNNKSERNADSPNKKVEKKAGKEPKAIRKEGKGSGKPAAAKPPRRKVPKTAAVTITGRDAGFSYSDALRTAREKISLAELGIEQTRIRRAVNGGVLIEIGGTEGPAKAESLASRLSEVLGPGATVVRPTIKDDLRIVGLDDSVTTDEVRCVLADAGECTPEQIRTGPIRTLSNGLGTVWVQCLLAAAIRLTTAGKIKIGWTVAKVEALKARPLQCYRCWEFGHVKHGCKSAEDRTKLCYRCGQEGHGARSCTASPRCVVCVKHGRDGNHRLGTSQCQAVKDRLNRGPDRRTGTAQEGNYDNGPKDPAM